MLVAFALSLLSLVPATPDDGVKFFHLPDVVAGGGAKSWNAFFDRPTLSLGVYRLKAGARDGQSPHGQDELYYVLEGAGRFTAGGKTVDVKPGGLYFVGARVEHRFHDITSDIVLLVFFSKAPAKGAAVRPRRGLTMQDRCKQEIVELHAFFQNWFRGGEVEFSRFESVLAPGFEIIPPSGARLDRAAILTGVKSGRGRDPKSKIRIENVAVRPIGDGMAVATYEEWVEKDGEERGRLSSAVFRANHETPNGVEWVHVQETWK